MISGPPDQLQMIAGPIPEQMATVIIPATNFYCPYPVLWAIILLSFGFGIYLGYRRSSTWRRLHFRILNLLTG